MTMQLMWFITWVPGMEQGIITGLGISLAEGARRGARAGRPPAAARPAVAPSPEKAENMAPAQRRWVVGPPPLDEPGSRGG
jgi:hypothetical protein